MLGCTRYYFHTIVRAKNRIGPHNEEIISVLIGLLLGGGYANNRTGEGVRIAIKQSIIHKEYLFLLFKFFQERGYCTNNPPRLYKTKLKNREKFYYGYEFYTFTFRSFIWIYDLFYKKGKKTLTLNDELYNIITPLSLAIWISDDGTRAGEGLRIATNAFTLSEIKFLTNVLETKFKLSCTIQKIGLLNKYSIYIKKNSMPELKSLIFKLNKDIVKHTLLYKKLGL